MNADIKEVFNFYFNFKVYATRKQFWLYFALPVAIFAALKYSLIDAKGQGVELSGEANIIINLIIIYVAFAIYIKRLRDAGFSPLLVLINFIPLVGNLIVMVLCGFFKTNHKISVSKLASIESDIEEDINAKT